MTDVAKTVEIIFSGIDNVSATTKTVGKEINSLGNSIGDIAAPFASATKAVIGFEAALAAMAAAGLTIAFNASKEFENAIIELDKVLGDTASTAGAEQAAKNLAAEYGESSASILESMANFKQAGFDLESSMGLAKNALDLVIAGGLEADQASNLLVATLKGFNAEAANAGHLIDILNETSNNYATNVEELAQGMSRVSPIAEQMGFSMEETAGLLTPIIEVFRSGDEAANALRTGLLRLTDDSRPVKDALASLGVSQTDLNGNLKTGKEIFYEVATAMQDMDAAQRSFLTQQLVGIEQAPKMSLLFSDLNKVMEITEGAMNSAGSASGEVAKRLDSAEVSINRFKTAFENLSISVGDSFRESTKGAIDGATAIEEALRSLVDDGAFEPLLSYINDFASDIGDIFSGIAESLPEAMAAVDFSSLTDGLDNLKGAFEGMFDGVDITTPEGLASVIQTVIDALGGLQNAAAGIINFLTPITSAIGSMVTKFNELDPSTQSAIGGLLGMGTALSGIAAILATGGALLAGIGALGAAIVGPVGLVAGLAALTTAAAAASSALSGWASDKWNADLIASTKALEEQNAAVEDLLEQLNELPIDANTVDIEVAINKGDFDEAQKLIDEAVAKEHEIQTKILMEQEEFEDAYAKLTSLGPLSEQELTIIAKAEGVDEIENAIIEITKERALAIKAEADLKPATEIIKVWTENHGTIEVKVPVDTSEVKEAQKEIEKVPTEKQLEIKLQGEIDKDIARIKANAATVQEAMEWEAKVDIAQAEEAAKRVESSFSSIDNTISSTADVIKSSLDTMSDPGTFEAKWQAREILEQEQDYREKALQMQEDLNKEQIAYLRARTEALQGGDVAIKITSDGLEPSLNMILWELIKKVQLEGSQLASEFLLGIA